MVSTTPVLILPATAHMDSGEVWEVELISNVLANRDCVVISSKIQEHLPLSHRKLTYLEFVELLKSKPKMVRDFISVVTNIFRISLSLSISLLSSHRLSSTGDLAFHQTKSSSQNVILTYWSLLPLVVWRYTSICSRPRQLCYYCN